MSILKSIIYSFYRGVIDSMSINKFLYLIIKSNKIRIKLVSCLILNGLIFLGSIFLFTHFLTPILRFVLSLLLSFPSVERIQNYLEWIYYSLWISPIYLISLILNTLWYQDIANEAIAIYPSVRMEERHSSSITGRIVDSLFRLIFNSIFLMYLFICFNLNYSLYLFNLSFLISLNSFEYKYIHFNWSSSHRIAFMERTNFVYFFGFGFPTALVASQFPRLIENGLLSLLLPVLIMTATASRPVPVDGVSLRVFGIVEFATNKTILMMNKIFRK
jgi:etoposide-induced 2.4 mRNA